MQIYFCEFWEINFFTGTFGGPASENLRDDFVQQFFCVQLKLCLCLIYFHSYFFATSMAKMSSDINFSNVLLKDTSYRKKYIMKYWKTKHLPWDGSVTLLKIDSSTGDFLWILRDFQEHLFYRKTPGDCLFGRIVLK